jgi:small nuclear ribonucleoprotein (snRNP)-like protein
MSENLNQNYLEKLILSQYKRDKYFNILLNDSIETRYFDNSEAREIFSIIKNHYEKYAEIPNDEVIINSSSNTHEIKEYLKDVNNVEEIKAAYIYDKTEE